MIYITRTHSIDVGHRIYGHESKCANLHGHCYKFGFSLLSRKGLDEIGRVIDFSKVKSMLCNWLDEHWDHKTLFYNEDPLYWFLIEKARDIVDPHSLVSLPCNPTAENLAKYFTDDIAPGLLYNTGVDLVKLTVWETEKCSATYVVDEYVIKKRIIEDAEHTVGNA